MGFELLAQIAKGRGLAHVAVVGAEEPDVLLAAIRARNEGLASPLLLGDPARINPFAQTHQLDLTGLEILTAISDAEKAERAVQLVEAGQADVIMKGLITTTALMSVVLREGRKRHHQLLSHVSLLEGPTLGRWLMTTDGALLPYPTFEQKVQQIRNAVSVMRRLGVAEPRVAILSASEEVNPKIPCSLEARRLAEESRPGGALHGFGFIEGPYDLGCALDSHTAEIKGVSGPVAGAADILVAPDIVAANLLTKAMIYLARSNVAAAVVGGHVPVAMVSRASPAEDKYHGLLLALACR